MLSPNISPEDKIVEKTPQFDLMATLKEVFREERETNNKKFELA